MCHKCKLLAWTLKQFNVISNKDLGGVNADLFQAMLWSMITWNELDEQAFRDYWRKSSILLLDWDADINILYECVKLKWRTKLLSWRSLLKL
jgi:hypothetical protein